MFTSAYPARWIAITVGAIAAALAVGFAIGPIAFAGNALAELAGMLASILFAVFVVERILASDRDARWQLVAKGTAETLRFGVIKAALVIYNELPAPRPPNADPYAMDAAHDLVGGLARLGAALRGHDARLHVGEFDTRALSDALLPSLTLIRATVLPRLLLIGRGPELIRPIVDFERSLETLDYHISISSQLGVPAVAFFEDLAAVVDGLGDVAAALELIAA